MIVQQSKNENINTDILRVFNFSLHKTEINLDKFEV